MDNKLYIIINNERITSNLLRSRIEELGNELLKNLDNIKRDMDTNVESILSYDICDKIVVLGNLSLLANYIGDLFLYFKSKELLYGCKPIKIHKMVLLLQIFFAYYDNPEYKNLFNASYKIRVCVCGFMIEELPLHDEFVDRNLYENNVIENISEYNLYDIPSNNSWFPNSALSKQLKDIAIIIFEYYADVSAKDIGEYLDKFKDCTIQKKIGDTITSFDFIDLVHKNKNVVSDNSRLMKCFDEIKKVLDSKYDN